MCDEYDDERMRAIWRVLAETQSLAVLQPESGVVEEPFVPPAVHLESDRKPRPKALVH